MRKDMKRVIIECTRRYDEWGLKRRATFRINTKCEDMEDLPAREPMRTRRTKSFNDRLAPMYGFLYKNVGRPWNDVWSEICEHADARSVDGWHLREHILSAVDTTGELHDRPWRWKDLYVDSDGILRCDHNTHSKWRRQRIRRHRDAKRRNEFKLGGRTYKKVNGFWYETVIVKQKAWDPVYEQSFIEVRERKIQLNRKRLRDLGLKNDNQA